MYNILELKHKFYVINKVTHIVHVIISIAIILKTLGQAPVTGWICHAFWQGSSCHWVDTVMKLIRFSIV